MWDMTEAVTYYKRQGAPSDQTALTARLKEAQQENGGGITHYCVAAMAEQLNVKPSYLLALIDKFTKTEPNTKKICIDADFESGETTLDVRIDARVNLTKIVLQYIKVLLKQPKHKLPSQSAQKG